MKGRVFSKTKVLMLLVLVTGTFSVYFVVQGQVEAGNATHDTIKRAAIIDQLYDDIPNPDFVRQATEYFEAAGYSLDYYATKDVTIDFYKKLPQLNYDYVVIRTHGVASQGNEKSVMLFTGERYAEDKYVSEQLFGYVQRATPLLQLAFTANSKDLSQWVTMNETYKIFRSPANRMEKAEEQYFVITPKLVEEQMTGKFHDTVFLIGGCNTMENTSLAEAFVKRGASQVIGWHDAVGSADNDWAMLGVLRENLINGNSPDQAVKLYMERYHKNFNPQSTILKVYP